MLPADRGDLTAGSSDAALTRYQLWSLAAAFLAGAALRLWGVGSLILLDDEFHALGAAQGNTFSYLFTHFGGADHCIPLAMFYKLLFSLTGLGELGARLPMLAASLLFCALVPVLLYPAVRTTALAWLIAISPFHIFYSRFARPYAIALLLGLLAVLSLWRASRSGNRRWLQLAALCAVLAPWFNLSFLAPLIAVLAAVSVWAFTAPGKALRAQWPGFLGVVLSGWALLLAPPLLVDSPAVFSKWPSGLVRSFKLGEAVRLGTGLVSPLAAALAVAAAALGLLRLFRREPPLALLLTLAAAAQAGVLWLVKPVSSDEGVVILRYALFCYTLYLTGLSCAVAWGLELSAGRLRKPAVVLVALLGSWLFMAGPLPQLARMPAEWRNHCSFQYSYDWAGKSGWDAGTGRFIPGAWPPFYTALRKLPPGSVTLLEAPWHYDYRANPLPFYQLYHRQHTAIAFVGEVNGRNRDSEWPLDRIKSRFRHFERLGSPQFNRRVRAGYLVIHKDWRAEQPRNADVIGAGEDMTRVIAYCRAQFGPPGYEDALLAVFRLGAETPAAR